MAKLVGGYSFVDWQQSCLESRKTYAVNRRSEHKARYGLHIKELSINTRILGDGSSTVFFTLSYPILVASQL
jgi:hypothetical protein